MVSLRQWHFATVGEALVHLCRSCPLNTLILNGETGFLQGRLFPSLAISVCLGACGFLFVSSVNQSSYHISIFWKFSCLLILFPFPLYFLLWVLNTFKKLFLFCPANEKKKRKRWSACYLELKVPRLCWIQEPLWLSDFLGDLKDPNSGTLKALKDHCREKWIGLINILGSHLRLIRIGRRINLEGIRLICKWARFYPSLMVLVGLSGHRFFCCTLPGSW